MLVEMQSHSSLENNLASCCETEHLHTLLKNFIPECVFQRYSCLHGPEDLQKSVHSSIINNSKTLRTNSIFISRKVGQLWYS